MLLNFAISTVCLNGEVLIIKLLKAINQEFHRKAHLNLIYLYDWLLVYHESQLEADFILHEYQ